MSLTLLGKAESPANAYVPYLDLLPPAVNFDPAITSYLLRLHHVIEENPTQLGPQFLLKFSADGVNFDGGPNYNSIIGYANDVPSPPASPYGMYATSAAYKASGAIFLCLDNLGMLSQGYSADLVIRSPGVVGGRNVDTVVDGVGSRGTWSDNMMPLGHITWGRWAGALGQKIKGLRVYNDVNNFSGRIELWGYSETAGAGESLQTAHFTTSCDMGAALPPPVQVNLGFRPKKISFNCWYNDKKGHGQCDAAGAGDCAFEYDAGAGLTKSYWAASNPIVGCTNLDNYCLGTVTPNATGFAITYSKGSVTPGGPANPTGLLSIGGVAVG